MAESSQFHREDVKLIDELLCTLKHEMQGRGRRNTWADVEVHSNTTRRAMERLRKLYLGGAKFYLTLSLANYFDGLGG